MKLSTNHPVKKRPKILIDNSSYHLRNMGDVAMLNIAITRLFKLWPQAQLTVFTEDPYQLASINGSIKPISMKGRRQWLQRDNVLGGLHHFIPNKLLSKLYSFEAFLRRTWPSVTRSWIARRLEKREVDCTPMQDYFEAIQNCDLLIATGGGYITDAFESHAIEVLETACLAKYYQKPVAFLGQGLGPITQEKLKNSVLKILPKIDLLLLREGILGKKITRDNAISDDKVIVSGDDALELAYLNRPNKLGNLIGLNLRIADYSGLDNEKARSIVRQVIEIAIELKDNVILPIGISQHDTEMDAETSAQIVNELGGVLATFGSPNPDSILDVIKEIGRCRVVITVSYHAGVFALSQGIPIIALAPSAYYSAKLLGLSSQFGSACQVVELDSPLWPQQLNNAIRNAWKNAEHSSPELLKAAQEQLEIQSKAYQRLTTLVNCDDINKGGKDD